MRQFLFLLITIIICNYSVAQLYTYKNFSYKDGLSMANVTSIFQTKNGTICLGMDGSGLIMYDGYTFQELSPDKIYNNLHVTSIIENHDTLFFTSKYHGLYSYYNSRFNIVVPTSQTRGDFLKVVQLDSSKVIITTTGVFLLKGNNLKKMHSFAHSKNEVIIKNVIVLKNDCILLSSLGNFHISSNLQRVVPLNNWLHYPKNTVDFIDFGYSNGESIFFYDKYLSKNLKIVLNDKQEIYDLDFYSITSPFKYGQEVLALYGDSHNKSSVVLTKTNEIFHSLSKGFVKVVHNYEIPLEKCQDIFIDKNGDYWVISSQKGLYKISLQAFTKLRLDPIYFSPSIHTIFKSSKEDVLVSDMDMSTYIGNIRFQNSNFKEYPFKTNAVLEYKDHLYLGTSKGIKIFDLTKKTILNTSYFNNEKITFLYLEDGILWVGIAEKGLWKIDLTGSKIITEKIDSKILPNYIYTAQTHSDKTKIYFGTNNGIFIYTKKTKEFSHLKTNKNIGYYIGVSVKDKFDNLWFTSDNALVGLLKNGEQVFIDDRKILPSTLFYTLNSDSYGDLLIGTNKGITKIKVDSKGKILSYRTYNNKTGFEGYETNMRAQFQDSNKIFLGTVEGLFLVNADLLNTISPPEKPVISINKNAILTSKENAIEFIFQVNNPKIKTIEYSYRIIGYQKNWSALNSENHLFLSDLPNGDFTLEVRASNDGKNFSEISKYPFSISLPFWKSKWFILLILIGIIVLNIYLLNKNRSFNTGNLFNTKETSITIRLTPQILLFGFIANTTTHFLSSTLDPTISSNLALILLTGLVTFALYLAALSARNNNRMAQYRLLLTTGFFLILVHNLTGVYLSNLHPFFILAVILINSLSSFILEKIKTVIIYSLIFILANSIIVIQLEDTVYNKYLYMLAVLISSFLSVIMTYLRFDSLEKLLFISGVINKGNIQAIAFNSKGIMTYVSENISDTINANNDVLIGKPLSFLNNFVPDEGDSTRVDLTTDFVDGKKYLVPMITSQGETNWIEWSCKVFTEDVKVILGQNVTERLELENTYELLVENAEDLIYQCDINGDLLFLNKSCYDKLGYSEQELSGKNSMFFVDKNYVSKVDQFYREHFEKNLESSYLEFPIKTKDEEIIWVGQHVTTLFKPGDKKTINGFLALARDITVKREQQHIIKEQRDDITSSINYAQKIQLNLLPNRDKFTRSFEEFCIFYKPKDIVSGDFYWLERIDNLTIFALGDCTGHGVPGSFMTLLGFNLLNNLILEQRIFHPGTILDELDTKLITALPRENGDENMNDGMEITICVFNHDTKELSFACAGSRFLIYEENSFNMFKGDTKHIGDKPIPEFNGYVTHFTKFLPESTMYLFTDGFQDQFGGIKDKKYSFRRMLELFEDNVRMSLNEHEIIIEEEFENWRSESVQTDDVTIIALRNIL